MTTDIVLDKLLAEIPLFRNLNATERRQLAEITRLEPWAAGATIARQGEECRKLSVVIEGKCEVVKHVQQPAPDGKLVRAAFVLAVLGPYDQFGEMSFFHPAPHSADVRAQSAVQLLRISYPDYKDLLDEGVMAAYKLSHNVVEVMAQRLRRMDDWIAELLAHQPSNAEHTREWSAFREKLCANWNL
ncbi:MAG TPA: cyclic nucleotide-binding domain-containing protein [Pirellulales bacterium]|jgi:CRP-like cAMP-binding protein|nr:cyclic nucleotide-binding domain-containing protein [Pirellulales bacterium]